MDILTLFNDAVKDNPILSLGTIVLLTLMFYLFYDYRTMKDNQTNRLVSARIGKADKKQKYDIVGKMVDLFSGKDEKIALELKKANVLLTVKEYLTIKSIGVIIGVLVAIFLNPLSVVFGTVFGVGFFSQQIISRILTAIGFGYAGSFIPFLWLKWLISRRRKLMATQLADSLLNMADALKSGHVIQEAIKIVGAEMPYPIGPEFTRAYREMETGKTLEQALRDLKDRINLEDFSMAVNAIEIQYEVGGKLEPLLRNMVKIMNDRAELKKEIQKTIANSKTVGIVLLVAPWLFIIVFTMLDKQTYMAMLQNMIGLIIIVVAILCYVIAAAIIIYIIKDVSKEV